jgi:hypothetical protein
MDNLSDKELLARYHEMLDKLCEIKHLRFRMKRNDISDEELVTMLKRPRTTQQWDMIENLLRDSIATIKTVIDERNLI